MPLDTDPLDRLEAQVRRLSWWSVLFVVGVLLAILVSVRWRTL